MTDAGLCREVDENMSDVLEGVAPDELFEHIARCERCRDARHEAEQLARQASEASLDYRMPPGFEERLLALVPADSPRLEPTAALVRPEAGVETNPLRATRSRPARRYGWLWLSAAAAVLLGLSWLASRSEPGLAAGPAARGGGAWQGEVLQVQRAFGSPSGLSRCTSNGVCEPAAVGDAIPAGARLETDGLTRALVRLSDGTSLALDRDTRFELDASERRRGRLLGGNLVAEVEPEGGAAPPGGALAVIETPGGRAEVLGTMFSLRAEEDRTRAEVGRGVIRLVDAEERSLTLRAGEAGQIGGRTEPSAESVLDLGRAFAWRSEAFEPSPERVERGALGELVAKRPRDQAELGGAVRLTSHDVKVRIVDNLARTEVEEVFTNQTNEVLEGIYRFPLPPGAQLERLALEVDGKLMEGAFVERERAAAIWRGAIVNSGGRKPAPREEIIWVPGPWKDPALLEWQRGNRFELRIFPIPKRSSRRVVLAYTELLPPSQGGRQYVYPLPQDPRGTTSVERFTLDVQLRGHDRERGLQVRGYPLKQVGEGAGAARLAFEARQFTPAGDLSIGYQLAQRGPLRAWAYQPSSERPQPSSGSYEDVPAGAPYVALRLRPELPRRAEYQPRDYVLVADSSRSMIGENYRRAARVVETALREMDRKDRVAVLACDSVCQSWPDGFRTPGPEAADAAARFLRGIQPEGASDLALAIERAAALGGRGSGRALRLVYVGDGTPTVGPIHPALLRRAVTDALPSGATLSAVAIGADADQTSLRNATEAGGGVTLAFAPGQRAEEVAYALLGATYGRTLRNARLELPEGMVAVAPQRLGSIAAGAEQLVVARLLAPGVSGHAVLRGELAGEPFEQRYALDLAATTSEGNAFVPRLYAAVAIAELSSSMEESARRRSVELSTRFNVASPYTSLLVLESAAMFRAFGLDNRRHAPQWSGERESQPAQTWGEGAADETLAEVADGVAPGDAPEWSAGLGSGSAGGSVALRAKKSSTPSASPRSAAPRAAPAARAPAAAEGDRWSEDGVSEAEAKRERVRPELGGPELIPPHLERPPLELPQRRMIPMRRVWDRLGRIDAPPRLLDATSPSRRSSLEARVQEHEGSRGALKDLYVVDFLAGHLERARASAERWSEKDPLDPDALTARADLAAQRGERELAIRILGSVVDVRPGDHKPQWRLARLHRWAGDPARGCRHSLAVAQLMLRDAKLVTEAVRCSRDIGQSSWAEELLAAVTPQVREQVQKLGAGERTQDALSGDLRVQATWEGAEHDLDLVILHPEGYRVSWLGAPTRAVISATDVLSVHREGLALRGAEAGQYAIEVVRASPSWGAVRGSVELQVAKEKRAIPFVLEGERLRVATAQIRLTPRLVPVEGWE